MKHSKSKKQRGGLFFFWQIVLGVFDGLIFIAAGFALAVFLIYKFATPAADQLVKRHIAQTSVIYDRSGKQSLYELHGEENRKIILHSEIPDVMRVATVATEDANFYSHFGVDPTGIARALKVNFQNDAVRQGGSTITQQLARSAFLTRDRTLKRKILEAIFALKIERHYSKTEILDQYLNQVPYGANAYGIETASVTYFGKQAKDLTLDEAALLAALPKAPSYYSPYNTHIKELVNRQKNILSRIKELRLRPENEVDQAMAADVAAKIKPLKQPIIAPHFVFFVLEQLENKYGKDFLQTGGLDIVTTLDLEMQKTAEAVVSSGVQRNFARGATNASLVAVNPKDGDILVMVGSRDFFDTSIDGQVNIATSLQQPGSSFKPFAYATAFEKGYQPETMILDAPTNFGPDGSGSDYIPRNYDGKFHGLLSMREALAQSLNIPAIKTLYLAGLDNTIELAQRLGITTLNDRKSYGLSLVIGGGDVKLVDMASAFSVFANDGVKNPQRSILKIADSKGKILEVAQSDPRRVLDPHIARKINSILSDNAARTPIFGPRSPLIMDDGRPVAAKTGTTQEFRDAWTVGFTPQIAVGVWAGNNNNAPMKAGADGVFVAAPIWHDFMTRYLAGKPVENFIAYDPNQNKSDANVEGAGQGAGMAAKITYYNNKTGKKISEKKAKKIDPEKVEQRIEYVQPENTSKSSFSFAMPAPTDPMFKRWSVDTLPNADTQK